MINFVCTFARKALLLSGPVVILINLKCFNKRVRVLNTASFVRYVFESQYAHKLLGINTAIERAPGKCCSPIAYDRKRLLSALFRGVTASL